MCGLQKGASSVAVEAGKPVQCKKCSTSGGRVKVGACSAKLNSSMIFMSQNWSNFPQTIAQIHVHYLKLKNHGSSSLHTHCHISAKTWICERDPYRFLSGFFSFINITQSHGKMKTHIPALLKILAPRWGWLHDTTQATGKISSCPDARLECKATRYKGGKD